MEPVYLKNLVSNEPSGSTTDLNAPYSFLEWKQRRPSFAEKDVVYHYNRYVIEWFERNKGKPISQKFLLRQKYLYLLDQLQLFFSEEEKNSWYSKVNLADEKELLLAIPYFAKKLKNIALYYLKLRKQLKDTKIRYNSVGTSQGLEQEVYRALLETFTSANKELSPYTQTIVPQFSALQQTLSIEIQEIYDDKEYFDVSTTKPVSASFDLFHSATEKYFQSKGISLSSDQWLFNCLSLQPTANFDAFFSNLTGQIFEVSDSNLLGSYIQTFLAENKFTLTFDTLSSTVEITDVPISQGDNYFYYPYGTTDTSLSIKKALKPLALSSLSIDGATAGTTLENSDTIFVKNGDTIQSAWLYFKEYEPSLKTVKATLVQDQTTSFIYPFPGYGLSAQGIEWTGASLETTKEYNFLSRDNKSLVNQAYWSQVLPLDSVDPIMLNNTSLASNGAIPNKNPNFADKFYIRPQQDFDTTIPRTQLSGAWLYRFERSAVPISPNSLNKILWPYCSVNVEEENYPTYLEKLSFEKICQKISVQDLDKSFFVAASSFELADKIYKINNVKDEDLDAVECCWLSAGYVELSSYGFFEQNGFTSLFPAGESTRFIWTGPNTTLEEVFRSISHSADCPFLTNTPTVSAFEWQKCSCKEVYYSPFGHPGTLFEEYNKHADCIIRDTTNQLQDFDFGSWRDNSNNTNIDSTQFAWYKTNSKQGWGDGRWVTSNVASPTPFVLERGKVYFYYRANSRTQDINFPSYSINYRFPTNKVVWAEAKKNVDGSWSSSNKASQMFLHAGDFIRVDRRPSTASFLISSVQVENISENKNGSIWAAFDTVAVGSASNSTTISWPVDNSVPIDGSNTQYPTTSIFELTAYDGWTITRLQDGDSQTILGVPAVTFVPPTTGTYSVSVTATKAGGQKITESTKIPQITAIPQYGQEDTQLQFETPSSGFLIEQPLYGWSYILNQPSANAFGAKPYWATLYTNKASNTKFKGVYSSGYSQTYIDGYLPNHAPEISPIEIQYGTVIEYERKSYSMTWEQPVVYKTFVGTSQWSQLSSSLNNFSNLSSIYSTKRQEELSVVYNTSTTDITLTNIKNGLPVEIYYYALNSFTWPVSVEVEQEIQAPTSTLFFESPKPWANLPNRFYSTVAAIPTLEETYTEEDVGGYFIPQNLGASQFINKDFTASLKSLTLSGTFLTEDTNIHIGGRGRTGQDQDTLYSWTEDNEWLKEPAVAGQLAGAVKKSLTKTLQTFIPYQTNTEDTTLGLVTPRSRFSPWGGPTDEQWTDTANQPQSFTGVPNVSAWVNSQVLKQNKKEIDCWATDIYGNQYALYKELDGVPVSQRYTVNGELWTRTNDQMVNSASVSLSSVYDTIGDLSLFDNNQIKQIDCFFDTLMIELPSKVLFVKLEYDYETAQLFTIRDNVVGAIDEFGLQNLNKKFERTWFFPQAKKVTTLISNLTGSTIIPELWELDIDSATIKKVFPLTENYYQTIFQQLSSAPITNSGRGTLHFNKTLQQYLITYEGTDYSNNLCVLDFIIEKQENHILKEVNYYQSTLDSGEPPTVDDAYLQTFVKNQTDSVQVVASNNPTSFTLLNYLSSVTVNNAGLFAFTLPVGIHQVNYQVSNSVGSTTYSLTLQIV